MKTKAQYTPGPWQVFPPDMPVQIKAILGYLDMDESQLIPVTRLGRGVNTEANARLIAAAPILFEALEALLNETKAGGWDCLPVEMAKYAIRKVKGK